MSAEFSCARCGTTSFVNEIRRVVVTVGPNKEAQFAAQVPTRRCANQQCNALTAMTNLEFGNPVNLAPVPTPEQKANLAAMAAAIVEAEGATNPPPAVSAEADAKPETTPIATGLKEVPASVEAPPSTEGADAVS